MSQGRQTRDGAAVRRVQVMLDEITIERAKALGDGNLSIGLRKMAKEAEMRVTGEGEKEMSKLDSVLSNAEAMMYNHVVNDYGDIVWLGPNGAIGRNIDFIFFG